MSVSQNIARPVTTRAFYDILRPQFPRNTPLPNRIGIAVSGGVDSLALCYLAAQMSRRKDLDFFGTTWYAFIINHGMREGSLQEAEKVAWILKDSLHNVVPRISTINWPTSGKEGSKTELNARVNRYRLLAHLCKTWQCDHLLVGHHMDDLAETVIMRLIKDTGHRGLAAIADVANIPESEDIYGAHDIRIHRPLLNFTKAELTSTIRECTTPFLVPVEDQTNKLPTFCLRNAIRSLLTADPCPLPPAFQTPSLNRFSREIKKHNEISAELVKAYVHLKCKLWPVREAAGTMLVKFPLDAFKEQEELLVRVLQNIAARLIPEHKTEWKKLQSAVRKLFFDNLDYVDVNDLKEEDEVDEYDSLELPGAASHRQTPKVGEESEDAKKTTAPSKKFDTLTSAQADIQAAKSDPQIPPDNKPKSIKKVRKLPEPFTACGLFWQPYTSRRWLVSRQPLKHTHVQQVEISLLPSTASAMRKWMLFDRRMWLLPPKKLPDYITHKQMKQAGVQFPLPLTHQQLRENGENSNLFFGEDEQILPISRYLIRPLKSEDLTKMKKCMRKADFERFKDKLADMAPGVTRFTMPVVVAIVDAGRLRAQRSAGRLMKRDQATPVFRKKPESDIPPQAQDTFVFRNVLESHTPVFKTALEQHFDAQNPPPLTTVPKKIEQEPVREREDEEKQDGMQLEVPILLPTLPPPMNLQPMMVPGRWYFKFRADMLQTIKGEPGEGETGGGIDDLL